MKSFLLLLLLASFQEGPLRLLFNFSVSSFDLGENQKRWVVIGICLNRLLLPVLRDFVAQEIPKHYTSLKSAHGIDTQVFGHFFEKDGPFELNYWGWQEHKFLRETLSQKVEQFQQKVMIPLVRQVMTKEAFLNAPIWKKLLRTANLVQNTYLGKMDARDQPSQKTNANMIWTKWL